MNAPGHLRAKDASLPCGPPLAATKRDKKIYPRFQAAQPIEKPRFERANPRKSNAIQRLMSRVFGANGHKPRKAKPIDGTDAAAD
jgi:hypothetical protein